MSTAGSLPIALQVGDAEVEVGRVHLDVEPVEQTDGGVRVRVRPRVAFARSFADFVRAHVDPEGASE